MIGYSHPDSPILFVILDIITAEEQIIFTIRLNNRRRQVEKPDYQVDGISGGTITSVGVDVMLKTCLNSYKSFLTNNDEE